PTYWFRQEINTDPSMNYTKLVPPPEIPHAFYSLPNGTLKDLLLYEYLYVAYVNASMESSNRANGALQMNDTKYYYLQERNAQMYAANASIYYGKLVPLLVQVVNELNTTGYLNETSFARGKEFIVKNGLPSDVTKLLTELGFTKYINIHDVEKQLNNTLISTHYEQVNITKLKEALEESDVAAFFNEFYGNNLESISNRTIYRICLNATGVGNATVKVDGKAYSLPASFNWNLGTKHNITCAQVVPGLFYDYVFQRLKVGNETFSNPNYQLTVLEPTNVTVVYVSRLSALSITIIAGTATLALVGLAVYIRRKRSSKR
ncbi:MAG: hypothetical protein ACPLGZ_03855, partial [Candidatus Pelagibacter ubique]